MFRNVLKVIPREKLREIVFHNKITTENDIENWKSYFVIILFFTLLIYFKPFKLNENEKKNATKSD